jgi:hypothetical protein
MKPEKRFSTQTIVATMATIVSVCALVVSVMQTYYQHKYLHAAAWPHIQLDESVMGNIDSTKNSVSIKFMNKGVGPAIVESMTFQYKGKQYGNIGELSKEIIGDNNHMGSFKKVSIGEVIAQNEVFDLIYIQGAAASRLLSAAIPQIKTRIVYASVHDEKWEFLTGAEFPDGYKTNKLN